MSSSRTQAACVLLAAAAIAACSDREPIAPGRSRLQTEAPQAVNPVNQAALGKAIFFDVTLSANGNQSCASCHAPEVGWTGPISAVNAAGAVYEGSIAGRFGNRKPPSSAYATLSPVFHLALDKRDALFVGGNFWDGRATGEELGSPAAEQALGPFLNPLEQALGAPADVVNRVCAGPYAALFQDVWGSNICQNVAAAYNAVGLSVAAFEGSAESNAFTSKFDAFRAGTAVLTREERLGLNLFRGKGKCAACHTLDAGPDGAALFTDFTFDNLGIPRNPENPFYDMAAFNPAGDAWIDQGLGEFLMTRAEYQALAEGNRGKHKVPTLRNVDLRPDESFVKAYGHNGYFKTLEGIVHFYNTRDTKPACSGALTEAEALAADCWPAAEVAANVNTAELGNLHLTHAQERAIVAFLRTLSDGYQP
jgi:cytochrome c peroxidase